MVLPKIETYPLFRCGNGFIMDWIPSRMNLMLPRESISSRKNMSQQSSRRDIDQIMSMSLFLWKKQADQKYAKE